MHSIHSKSFYISHVQGSSNGQGRISMKTRNPRKFECGSRRCTIYLSCGTEAGEQHQMPAMAQGTFCAARLWVQIHIQRERILPIDST